MQISNIPLFGILLFLNLQLVSAYPASNRLMTNSDIDVLKVLLHRLEESIPERRGVDRVPTETTEDLNLEDTALLKEDDGEQQSQTRLSEAEIRDFLSARNLKTVRNDSRRSSGCFGRRLDRIGSMSSLGCNTVGRYNPKKR